MGEKVDKDSEFQWKKFLPLAILILISLVAYFSGIQKHFSLENLKYYRAILEENVNLHPYLAPLCYVVLYSIFVMVSLPLGAFMTILGGFLFFQPWGTLYAVIGATIGAVSIFLIARVSTEGFLKTKAAPFLDKFSKGFQENEANYMLFLRFVPVFPFWLVNLAPAFLGVRVRTYIWTTMIGILPGAYAYAQAGVGLGSILDSNQEFSIKSIFTKDMQIALVALGLVSLLPIIIKKLKKQ